MRKLILPIALLAMAALLGAAVAIDCVRLAAAARYRVDLADAEMVKPEIRFVNLLSGYAKSTPEIQSAISNLKSIHGRRARMDGYEALVASFRKTMSAEIDVSNPLDRKFMDDAAGAMNRRDVAQKQYDEEVANYQNFLNSWQGKVARAFSSQARLDSTPSP
jgi:hypothetical protein